VLYQEILESLKEPKNIPSLGLDDELVTIWDIKEIELQSNESNKIDSVFLDKDIPYKAFIKDIARSVELPVSSVVGTKFVAFDKKGKRISKEITQEFRQVEFINCEIEFQEKTTSFVDKELRNRLVFY
jgi:CRISPR-associated protein Cas5t